MLAIWLADVGRFCYSLALINVKIYVVVPEFPHASIMYVWPTRSKCLEAVRGLLNLNLFSSE